MRADPSTQIPERETRTWPRLLREPLLHFLLLGGAVFGLHHALAAEEGAARAIEVGAQKRAELLALFEQRQLRPATPEEAAAIIARFTEDEVLLREASRLELLRNDPELRDHAIARMRGLLQASAAPAPATEAELRAYYAAHRERYRESPSLSFTEYFVASGSHAADDARSLLSQLRAGQYVDTQPVVHSQRPAAEIAALYGAPFVERVRALAREDWQLLRSPRGLHVVKLAGQAKADDSSFELLRERLSADLVAERTQQHFQEELARLSARWGVTALAP